MTPQERQMVADLFDRLGSLESERRDPDAERVIREGLGRAPNAVYALVQSVLVQDEALKRANARIEGLEHAVGSQPAQGGGFLDSMRNVLTGRGSVPSVRPGSSGQASGGQGSSGAWGPRPDAPPPGYPPQGYQQVYPPGYPQGAPMGGGMMGGHGGSFLGTAAATVAGVVGGAMLLNGIRSAFGHSGGNQAFGGGFGSSPSPWGGGDGGGLSRDAGVGDIGRSHYDDPLARQDAQQDAQQDLEDDDRADDAAEDAADYGDDGSDYGDDGGSDE